MIESFFLIGKTTMFLVIFSIIMHKNKMYLFLFIYLLLILASDFGFNDIFFLINLASQLLLMILFVYVHHKKKQFLRRAGFFGMIYSFSSLLLLLIYPRIQLYSRLLNLPSIFILFVLYYLYQHGKYGEIEVFKQPKRYDIEIYQKFMIGTRLMVISALTIIFVFVAAISLHELGHALTAKYYGCRITKAIIYDGENLPHTEIVCENGSGNNTIIALAGIFFPLVLGLLLLWFGEPSTEGISYIIIGYAFYFSGKDIESFLPSQAIIFLVGIVSLMFFVLGMRSMVTHLYEEENLKHHLH